MFQYYSLQSALSSTVW